jgi:hypothetical protein
VTKVAYRPNQSSVVRDSYLVMAKLPRVPGGLAAEFGSVAEAKSQAAEKMVGAIRRLAKKHDTEVQIETKGILSSGFVKIKCDRYFANLVAELPTVARCEQERAMGQHNKGPRFNR